MNPSRAARPDPVQELEAMSDTRVLTRAGLWSIFAATAFAIGWAAWAPIDEGVPAQGLVTVDTRRKSVQHLQGGIVKDVLVREGDLVTEGQVLMTLEPASSRANMESVRQHYMSLRASESRLLAEQAGVERISWHADLQAAAGDPLIQGQMRVQEQLMRSRRAAQAATRAALEQNLGGLQASLEGIQRNVVHRTRQLALVQEELAGIRDLVRDGYAPRSRQLELERTSAELSSQLVDLEAAGQRARSGMEEVRQRLALSRAEELKEVETQLSDIRREVQADAEKLKALDEDLARTSLRAPATGQVIGLAVQTRGGVITPGQRVMEIVPSQALLVIEARVTPTVIDRIHPGLATDVRLSAFAHSPQLVIEGRVTSVSGDLLTDPDTRQSYYLARVQLTEAGRQALGKRQLQPGMAAEVMIRTGERSLLAYLAYPLVRRLATAMKEE